MLDARSIACALLLFSTQLAQTPSRRDRSVAPCIAVDSFGAPRVSGSIADPALTETSGLAASRVHRDVYYAHNDSGDRARFFAIDARGARRGEFVVDGVDAVDWEDVAVGPCGGDRSCVYLADIGDNGARRAGVAIHRVVEPSVLAAGPSVRHVNAESLRFTYPDGPHDAEAVAVDPRTAAIYVFTKALRHTRVYRLDASAWSGVHPVATFVRDIDVRGGLVPFVTAADLHPCAPRVLIRTYSAALEFRAPEGATLEDALATPPREVPSAVELQSEAIAYRADGRGYLTVAEGSHATIHEVDAAP